MIDLNRIFLGVKFEDEVIVQGDYAAFKGGFQTINEKSIKFIPEIMDVDPDSGIVYLKEGCSFPKPEELKGEDEFEQ